MAYLLEMSVSAIVSAEFNTPLFSTTGVVNLV